MKKLLLKTVLLLAVCFSISLNAQTAGTLSFTINQTSHASTFDGTKRCLAIWIEYNSTGTTWTYVKSLLVRGKNTPNGHLPTWNTAAAGSTTGLTTTSTLASMASTTVTWDGKNASSVLQPDGNYRVAVQETWDHGTAGTATKYITFTKGPTNVSQTPAADANFTGMSLTWNATLAVDTFGSKPDALVYPNPTKGIVNIDFKNEIKNIRVVNLLGEEVLNTVVDPALNETSKRIDLSNLANGVYIILLSNDKGTSNFKVDLSK